MKTLSFWAKTNPKKAIGLIVLFELTKLSIGTAIGYDFLESLPSFVIFYSIIGLILLITFTQTNFKINSVNLDKSKFYNFRIRSSAIIFYGSFLLSILFGNYFKNIGYYADNENFANATISIKTDSVSLSQTLKFQENQLKISHFKDKKNSIISRNQSDSDSSEGGRRIGYFLLFILGIVLTGAVLYLSCILACGSYGVLAIISLLVSVGFMGGSIYFLIKTFRKEIKPYKEMEKTEKRKEWKRYLTSVLIGLATFVSLYLLALL